MSKQVVRVYFIDNCVRALGIEQNTTAAQLRELVVERIGLKQDACFSLFEKKDEKIKVLWDKEKAEKKKNEEFAPKFLFKKKIFLKDDDREMEDPIAKDLIYKQV